VDRTPERRARRRFGLRPASESAPGSGGCGSGSASVRVAEQVQLEIDRGGDLPGFAWTGLALRLDLAGLGSALGFARAVCRSAPCVAQHLQGRGRMRACLRHAVRSVAAGSSAATQGSTRCHHDGRGGG
jgi:hypothetical protein